MRSSDRIQRFNDHRRFANGLVRFLSGILVMLTSATVSSQQGSDISTDPFVAIYEQAAQSIEQWRFAFQPHVNTPGASDLARKILEPNGFVDFHARAARAWADGLQNSATTNLGDMSMLHNGVQGFNQAAMEIVHLMDLMLDPADFGPVDAGGSRARIEELMSTCYFAPPGEEIDGCPLLPKVRVAAAQPFTHLRAIYDDESGFEVDFDVVNQGDSTAEAVLLRIELDHGAVTALLPDRGSCEQVGFGWNCDLGTLEVGDRIGFSANVEAGLDIEQPVTELTAAVLSVGASSARTKLDPALTQGGFKWETTDCDERFREAVRSFSLDALDAAEKVSGESIEGLPAARLYEPDDEYPEANALVEEIIRNGGADDLLVDDPEGNFRNEFLRMLRKESYLGSCSTSPAPELDKVARSRTDVEGRHRDISRLRVRCEDDVRERIRDFEATLQVTGRQYEQADVDSAGELGAEKASKFLANRLLKMVTAGTRMAAVPAGIGVLSASLSSIQAADAAADLVLLTEAMLELPGIFALLENLAYLEGLEQRYEDLMEAQNHLLEEIQDLHDAECFCE